MAEYKILTDSTADLPQAFVEENNLGIISLTYIIDDETYSGETGVELEPQEFYARVRDGKMPTTSQANPDQVRAAIDKAVTEEGCKEVVMIGLSSGISGTSNSMRIGAEDYMEDNPDVKVYVIDSLCASLGEGLFVYYAVKNRKDGMSAADNAKWLEEHKLNIVHAFTVDDLFHLYRGGRVKKSAAIVGSIVNLKPILHVDDEGHLINLSTLRGRKKSLKALVDYMDEHIGSYKDKNEVIFISHGDCEEDAEFVATEIKERFGYDSFVINYIGPTIGAHSGPGTVALFFLGETR